MSRYYNPHASTPRQRVPARTKSWRSQGFLAFDGHGHPLAGRGSRRNGLGRRTQGGASSPMVRGREPECEPLVGDPGTTPTCGLTRPGLLPWLPMSRTISGQATLLAVAGLVALGLGVTVIAWLVLDGPDTKAAVEAAERDGHDFGLEADMDACIVEALDRAETCRGQMMCTVKEQAFLLACLERASRSPASCQDVPDTTLRVRSEEWQAAVCVEHGREGDPACAQIVRVVQRACKKEPARVTETTPYQRSESAPGT